MKAIMVMFDSLNRNLLAPYGEGFVKTPNFDRLKEKTVTFNNSYAGSLPCMPARRELHTGRYNFMHRSWGPMEPFDISMPGILKQNGVHTHLVSDHSHYWEEGGCNYHTRYSTWECIRGQEGDPYKCNLNSDQSTEEHLGQKSFLFQRDLWNREYIRKNDAYPLKETFEKGLEFIEVNGKADQWFLQLECFDPHEPFFVEDVYKEIYGVDKERNDDDWPEYRRVIHGEDTTHFQKSYAALVTKCDEYLGKVLDKMDDLDLWKDTMLIVNTDHGFLLGEHDWWGKSVMPIYNEIANTPLFIWDPRLDMCKDMYRESIVQTIDLAPTLLEYFGLEIPKEMLGKPVYSVMKEDTPIREVALFGVFGSNINITDGRYVYMKGIQHEGALYQYTLMPTHMRSMFSLEELKTAELFDGFKFVANCPVLKIDATVWHEGSEYSFSGRQNSSGQYDTYLFDLLADPKQENPYRNSELERKFDERIVEIFNDNEAPNELYFRFGLKCHGLT